MRRPTNAAIAAAGRLLVFQRTAPWVLPRRDRPLTRAERWLFRSVPASQRLARWSLYWAREGVTLAFLHPRLMDLPQRLALRNLRVAVRDPALRARLTPDYRIGCKRILLSNDYLPALTRQNVEVVTDGIREVRARGILTDDGIEHPADTIIFATGFDATRPNVQRSRAYPAPVANAAYPPVSRMPANPANRALKVNARFLADRTSIPNDSAASWLRCRPCWY